MSIASLRARLTRLEAQSAANQPDDFEAVLATLSIRQLFAIVNDEPDVQAMNEELVATCEDLAELRRQHTERLRSWAATGR